MADHIDYVVQLVGIDHVGLGLDYVFDRQEMDDFVKANPSMFPPDEGYVNGVQMVEPEQVPAIAAALLARGYTTRDVQKVMGHNFARVARATWPKK